MKVLYVDPICYKAHAYYNRRNIELLSQICELNVLFTENYLNCGEDQHFKVYSYKTPLSYFIEYNNCKNLLWKRIKNKIGQIKIMREILRLIKAEKFDLVIFSCVDMIVFSRMTRNLNYNIAFVDHAIYRIGIHKRIRNSWRKLNNNLKVCVFEEYISDYLRNKLELTNEIFVLHHPICADNLIDNLNYTDNLDEIKVFAPSHFNSREFVEELYNKRKNLNRNVKICIKSNLDYNERNFVCYSNYLPREDYAKRFCNADYILIPYNSLYNFRVSGVVFDALVRKKKILLIKGNTLEAYAKRYPNLFHVFSGVDEFIGFFNNCTRESIMKDYNELFYMDLERYLRDYSDQTVICDFGKLLGK